MTLPCTPRLCFVLILLLGAQIGTAQVAITRLFTVGTDIPDNGELVSTRGITYGGGAVTSVQVLLNISGQGDGGWNGDLYAALGHDTGYAVLLNRPGRAPGRSFGYGDSGLNVTFADAAALGDVHVYRQTLNGAATVPLAGALTGTWAPDARRVDPLTVVAADTRDAGLNGFAGQGANGAWNLFIADVSTGGRHRLESWGLRVETTPVPGSPVVLGGDRIESVGGPRTLTGATMIEGDVTVGGNQALTFGGEVSLSGVRTIGVEHVATLAGGVSQAQAGSSLRKTGPGTLLLTGAGSYSGGTEVVEGRLWVNNATGSATGTGPVVVSGTGEIGGHGHFDGHLTLAGGGTVAPGDSPGTLTVGSATWGAGGQYSWEINAAAGGAGVDPGWDRLSVSGTLEVTATPADPFTVRLVSLTLANTAGAVHDFDDTQVYRWEIATAAGGIVGFEMAKFALDRGSFANQALGNFSLGQDGTTIYVSFTPVPEPAGIALVVSVALLAGAAWRSVRRGRD